MGQTIHEAEMEQRAMAKLKAVRDYRTDSKQFPALHAFANGRDRRDTDCMERGSFWTVTFCTTSDRPSLTTSYSMGVAHRKPPTCDDVLQCLCMDAQSYDNARTFEEWASDYGYDTDSRKAEAIYRTVGEHAKALRHLLGADYDCIVAAGAREWESEDA